MDEAMKATKTLGRIRLAVRLVESQSCVKKEKGVY